MFRHLSMVATVVVFCTLAFTQTTTLSVETRNNTSACSAVGIPSHCKAGFTGMSSVSSGAYNAAPGNVSDVDIHEALYPGTNTLVFSHFQPWFCMQSGSTVTGTGTNCGGHVQVGYDSNDTATVNAQMNDMIRRRLDGVALDWYGPNKPTHEGTTLKIRDNLDARCAGSQNCPLLMALTEDQGAWTTACPLNGGGVDRTTCIAQSMIADLNYMDATYFGHPSYLKVDPQSKKPSAAGRPVVMYFICEECFTNPVPNWTAIWGQVRAVANNFANGNGLFIFRNSGGFQHVETDGAFAWINHYGSNDPYGLIYLDNFYTSSLRFPLLLPFGGSWKGFDNTNAPWAASPGTITPQECGSTWLQTLRRMSEANRYSITNQLPFLQVVTWNDYDEGTEVETGIDNCLTLNASVASGVLSWTRNFSAPSGSESTINRYDVYDTLDGQSLLKKATLSVGTNAVTLDTLSLTPGNHTFYVKAVGAPFVLNKMSNGVQYKIDFTLSVAPGSRMIDRGQSTTYNVTVTPVNFTTPVALSVTGLPAGATATFNPSSTLSTSTLTVTTLSTTPRGNYSLVVTGSASGLVRTAKISLKLK